MPQDGIVVFAFGVPSSIRANRRLSAIALDKAQNLSAPIFTQRDIDITSDGVEVTYIEDDDGPPPTLRIAREAVQWAQERGITTLWVVAANSGDRYPHLLRCARDLICAVGEAEAEIKVRVCGQIFSYSKDEWFCEDSTQERTQSEENWVPRERIVRLLPMWLYKLVAS